MDVPILPSESDFVHFDGFPSIASIFVLLLLCIGLMILIHSLGLDEGLQQHRSIDFGGVQQRSMVKVSNPFVLELDDTCKDLKGGLRCSLSTLCPCNAVVLWGPRIQAIHDLMIHPGRNIRKSLLSDWNREGDSEPLHRDVIRLERDGKHSISLPCPDGVTVETLGEMPRQRYPVVVFVLTPDPHVVTGDGDNPDSSMQQQRSNDVYGSHSRTEPEPDNAIIGLFSIIHLKDELVQQASHVLAKYVKTAGIPIYSLQALYVSSDDETETSQNSNDVHIHRDSQSSQDLLAQDFSESQDTRSQTHADSYNQTSCSESSAISSASPCTSLRQRSTFQCSEAGCSEYARLHSSHKPVIKSPISKETADIDDNCKDQACESENHQNKPNMFLKPSTTQDHLPSESVEHIDTINGADSNSRSSRDFSKPLSNCVVCQSRLAKCALLPCRHNCVCVNCLQLLDKCPMCRGPIESYFIVAGSDGLQEDSDGEEDLLEEMQRHGVADRINNFFERVNQVVGFQ